MAKYITHIYKAGKGYLRVKIESSRPIFNKDGIKVGDHPAKYAEFNGGVFETDDKEVIKKLESLSSFGVDFYRKDKADESEEEESKEKTQEDNLEGMTRQELLQLAKDKELEVDSKATKKELLELLKEK